MAKTAQSSTVLKTWNKLSFVNKVYAVLFVFLLVAMAISIPFVAGDKSLGDTRSKAASETEFCVDIVDHEPTPGAGQIKTCPSGGGWFTQGNVCCKLKDEGGGGGQGGGDGEADDPTADAGGGNPCDVPGAEVTGCEGGPAGGGGGGGGGVGAIVDNIKKAVTKPNRETMQAICPFIITFIEEEGLPETSEDTKALKQYLKAHNTEYRGWGRIDQFSGSEIYRFAKRYCEGFPTPTPTPTPAP